MKSIPTLLLALTAAPCACGAGLTFSGNSLPVLTPTVEASTGLQALYVVNDVKGVSATYTARGGNTVTWYSYDSRGGGFAEEITGGIVHSGRDWTLEQVKGDTGYIIEDGDTRFYCWVVDYAAHPLVMRSLEWDSDLSDCSMTALHFDGEASAITYYTINGRGEDLDRGLKVSFSTQQYDEESLQWQTVETDDIFAYLSETVYVNAPLCRTDFTLTGDAFMTQWGRTQRITSPEVEPAAVECRSQASQEERDSSNEDKSGMGEGLGGSAPCTVTFSAQATEGAVFTEWMISNSPEFDDVQNRFSETEFEYTFRDLGTYYVKFMCANAAGTCEYYGEPYTISIGESMLLCPNAFSPGASEGVNDEWKVSYRSIVEFECAIFNRHGVKMTSFTDPSLGWDGKYKGKLVPAGAYYYVIKAKGADGKEYKLGGDINIVGYN